jgi:hypothetical protein
MPANDYSIGRDLSFTLSTPNGPLGLSGVTDYSAKKKNTMLTSKRLTGRNHHAVIPDGWELTIKLDRKDGSLDRYFAARDADYYNGVNVKNGTIYETITEADGSTSQYRYTEVALQFEGAGDWKGDAFISITIMAYATERQQVT